MYWIYGAFWIDIVLILMMALRKQATYPNGGNDFTRKNYSKFLVFLFFVPITFVSACRSNFIDTSDYILMYEAVGTNIENVNSVVLQDVEKGYLYFTYFLNRITTDPQILFIVTSIFIDFCFIKFICLESENPDFSMLIFLCKIWLNTMNGLRQYMVAAAVCLLWIIWSKAPKKIFNDILFIVSLILLMQFHTSVVICIFVFLLSRGKFLNIGVFLMVLGSITIYLIPGLYNSVFTMLLDDTEYIKYLNETATMGIMRFLVNSVPFALVVAYQITVKDKDFEQDHRMSWFMNITVVNFCFSLLALRMVFFARIGMYFEIFDLVLIPKLVNRIFEKNVAKLIIFAAFVLYIVFFWFQIDAFGGYIDNFELFFEVAK